MRTIFAVALVLFVGCAPKPVPDFVGGVGTYHGHSDAVVGVAWSPDGTRIASASDDGTVRVWDSQTGADVTKYTGHSAFVFAVAWSPDGRQVVSAGFDQSAHIWDAATGQHVRTYGGHSGPIFGVDWSPDGRSIVTGSDDHTAKIWDAATGATQLTYSGHGQSGVRLVRWSPDGARVVSAGQEGTAQVWDASNGHLDATVSLLPNAAWGAAWSKDGTRIAAAAGNNAYAHGGETVIIADAAAGTTEFTLAGIGPSSQTWGDGTFGVAFSPDGQRIATGSADNSVRTWNATTGAAENSNSHHTNVVWTVAWSPDSKRIASASQDGTVDVTEPP